MQCAVCSVQDDERDIYITLHTYYHMPQDQLILGWPMPEVAAAAFDHLLIEVKKLLILHIIIMDYALRLIPSQKWGRV